MLVCDPSCFVAAHVFDGFVMFVIGCIVPPVAPAMYSVPLKKVMLLLPWLGFRGRGGVGQAAALGCLLACRQDLWLWASRLAIVGGGLRLLALGLYL